MILQQILEDNPSLIKTWSDISVMILKYGTEELYSEAIDPIAMNRKYVETDIPIENSDETCENVEDDVQ